MTTWLGHHACSSSLPWSRFLASPVCHHHTQYSSQNTIIIIHDDSSSLFYATWLATCNSGKTCTFLKSTLTSQNPQPHSTRLKVGNKILKSPWDTPREKTTYGTPRTSLKDFEELHISLMTPNHSHDLTSSIIINHQSSSLSFIPKKSWPVCRHILSHTHTFLCKGLSL